LTIQSFFSKTALGARKQNEAGNRKIGWLPDYLADAWEPSVHDLCDLKKALDPHKAKFEAVYLPIRHKIFAHKAFDDVALVSNLIAKAIIKEIDDVLCFLFNLIEFLWQLFHNGRKIKLDGQAEYVSHKERIKGTTREVLVALAASQVN
jgi:hypothetical protein